ncbi:ATP-binding protein, partial [Myxococcota bacterium]
MSEQRGATQAALDGMSGGDEAADFVGQGQALLAQLRGEVQTYLRLRAARALLSREIERYRAKNQDPLLMRAGAIFAALTLQAFSGVQTDVGDDDRPRLLGWRQGGKAVPVEGMSSGTRDQLYLALRLATLEHFLEGVEPVPLVVDDILIHFDDARARATLNVLAEFSKKTQ